MEKSQYISIMIQSLKKKSAVLDTIMELNIQQKEELENPALDPDGRKESGTDTAAGIVG